MESNKDKPFEKLTSGWRLACLLPLLLLGLSYLRIWGDSGSAAFGGKIIDAALAQPIWGTALANNLLLFALAQVALHLALGLVCITLALLSDFAWKTPSCTRRNWILVWSIVTSAWVLIANASWFPTSSLGSPYADIAAARWNGINLLGAASGIILAAATATTLRAISRIRIRSLGILARVAVPVTALILVVSVTPFTMSAAVSRPVQSQPNVIIIGLDSLRFDAVRNGNTPAIDRFLDESATFSDATTSLARTFPAWVSVLSGKHPHTTGATMNLLPRDLIHTGQTLPQLMKRAGYKSIYAIDEVRFSNLDTSYGFDEMIAPPIGATDFLLGFFADSPLSNIMVNTPVGRVLFPYAYANRAAALTYDPDTFVHRVESGVRTDDPTFLAVHLTLAHWPYSWAGTPAPPEDDSSVGLEKAYAQAVSRLDQQFAYLVRVLEKRGLLANAIVVVLSDHGESLGGMCAEDHGGSEIVDPLFDRSKIFGHGTSVFSSDQYHIVMSVRSFGKTPLSDFAKGLTVSAPVSLEDITPTIVDLLSLGSEESFDGVSLVPVLQGYKPDPAVFGTRVRFTETEFNPGGITPGKFMTSSALRSAASYYRVDPSTDRVTIRQADVAAIMAKRQYAAFRDGKLLAAFPSEDPTVRGLQLAYIPGEGHLPEWIADETTAESHVDAAPLWIALTTRFPELRTQIGFASANPGTVRN